MTVEASFLAIIIVVKDSTSASAFLGDELFGSFLPLFFIFDVGVDLSLFNEETATSGLLLLAVTPSFFLLVFLVVLRVNQERF